MARATQRKIMVGRNISGLPTHWYRFYKLGKYWASACGVCLSLYEQQHVGPVSVNVALAKMTCDACRKRLAAMLETAEDYQWEDLFHGFQ